MEQNTNNQITIRHLLLVGQSLCVLRSVSPESDRLALTIAIEGTLRLHETAQIVGAEPAEIQALKSVMAELRAFSEEAKASLNEKDYSDVASVIGEAVEGAAQEAYQKGRDEGYEKGVDEGYEKGINADDVSAAEEAYQKGREEGYEKGVEEGYEKGLEEGYEKGINANKG